MHQQRVFQPWNGVRFIGRGSVVVVFGLLMLAATLGGNVKDVHAQLHNSGERYSATSAALNTEVPAFSPVGKSNVFPYGACTWWANERYRQLHGVYVPWTTHANAWQWSDRARDFRWRVSQTPKWGDILNLQPNVQGASNFGHVAVVERILNNGEVIASSMSWGANPQVVTYFYFTPGPGVTFIRR